MLQYNRKDGEYNEYGWHYCYHRINNFDITLCSE